MPGLALPSDLLERVCRENFLDFAGARPRPVDPERAAALARAVDREVCRMTVDRQVQEETHAVCDALCQACAG